MLLHAPVDNTVDGSIVSRNILEKKKIKKERNIFVNDASLEFFFTRNHR